VKEIPNDNKTSLPLSPNDPIVFSVNEKVLTMLSELGSVNEICTSAITTTLSGPTTAKVGEKLSLQIITKDREGKERKNGGDEFKIECKEMKRNEIELKDHQDGKYSIELIFPEIKQQQNASVSISVLLDGQHVQGSPHSIRRINPNPVLQGKFIRKFGSNGSNDGQFSSPRGIAIDNNCVYIADISNHRIQVFTKEGTFLRKWGKSGNAQGEMNAPWGIGVDTENLFVADYSNQRIQVFQKQTGTFVRLWSVGAYPYDLCLIENKVLITTNGHEVHIYQKNNGQLLQRWGGAGSTTGLFSYPGITSDGHKIYVSDTSNNRVQVFTMEGKYLSHWGTSGQGEGQVYSPIGLLHADGMIYLNTNDGRVQCFTVNGEYKKTLMKQGSKDGEIQSNVYGMDLDGEKLFVCDCGSHRIQVIE